MAAPSEDKIVSSDLVHQILHLKETDFEDFEKWEKIGKGGFGIVYKAFCKSHHDHVAVKKLNSNKRDNSIDGKTEIDTLFTAITHEFVVNLKGVLYLKETELCIVMEYCRYGSLLDVRKKIPDTKEAFQKGWPRFLTMMLEISRGVCFLHNKGFTHNDLKPDNVFVTKHLTAKIGDVGLAEYKKSLQSCEESKDDGQILFPKGTALYISPERYKEPKREGLESDDMYSFAFLLWKFLTKKKIFNESKNNTNTYNTIREWVTQGHRPDIGEKSFIKRMGTPDEVVAVIREGWHEDVTKRPKFQDVAERFNQLIKNYKTEDLERADIYIKRKLESTSESTSSESRPANTSPPRFLRDPNDEDGTDSVQSLDLGAGREEISDLKISDGHITTGRSVGQSCDGRDHAVEQPQGHHNEQGMQDGQPEGVQKELHPMDSEEEIYDPKTKRFLKASQRKSLSGITDNKTHHRVTERQFSAKSAAMEQAGAAFPTSGYRRGQHPKAAMSSAMSHVMHSVTSSHHQHHPSVQNQPASNQTFQPTMMPNSGYSPPVSCIPKLEKSGSSCSSSFTGDKDGSPSTIHINNVCQMTVNYGAPQPGYQPAIPTQPYPVSALTTSVEKVTKEDISKIVEGVCGKYLALSSQLEMEKEGVEIRHDYDKFGTREQTFRLIRSWVIKNGSEATRTALANALYKVEAYQEAGML